MSKEIVLFRQTGLGKKIAALENKCIQYDYDELISAEECLYEKYNQELKLQQLKYRNMQILEELELTKMQIKMK